MRDYRLAGVALAAWAGALCAHLTLWWPLGLLVLVALARRRRVVCVGLVAVYAAVGLLVALNAADAADGPVADLARSGAQVRFELRITAPAHVTAGRYGKRYLVPTRLTRVDGRGRAFAVATAAVVSGDARWARVAPGATIQGTGRLSLAGDGAVFVAATGPPVVLSEPPWWRAGPEGMRAAVRRSVAAQPDEPRALLPALVDGERTEVPEGLKADFATAGLTHLMAVSGTNVTIVIGFVLIIARWSKVRGRWLLVVGAAGVLGFVLVAGPEPSVLRAAVMGTIGLIGLADQERGIRILAAATLVLLLGSPPLAWSIGFALSVSATAGILVVAPEWRDSLMRWMPRPAAEAIAVPAAAQLACTPLIACISGQVSLVAVFANIAAEPAVAPATVLGLLAGLVTLAVPVIGGGLGAIACVCVAWICWVAHRAAALPQAAIGWGSGAMAIVVLVVLTWLFATLAPRLLRHRRAGATALVMLALVVTVSVPSFGWPPSGWVMVMCDVGQGDGIVLNAGNGAGVVVDAGPDPRKIDRCLARVHIRRVPLVVLTHFHADHVDGLSGVINGRTVGQIWTTRLRDPPTGVQTVVSAAGEIPTIAVATGGTATVGQVELQVLWPGPDSPVEGPGDGSTANESSVVILARVDRVTILLTGDIQPEGQAGLARLVPGLHVDVLKVPHHGSRYQDADWLTSVGARLALISVGAGNDYGHPAASTIATLTSAGARVLRTDRNGDIAVVEGADGPAVLVDR